MKPNGVVESGSSSKEFASTHWSVVLSCAAGSGGEDSKAEEALSQLCRTYWRPIFTFICRRGHAATDAQDLTQDFFVMVLKGKLLHFADPSRGRFRSLLLKSLQNFLIGAHEKRQALKRGGAVDFVSFDDWMAEAPSHLSVPEQALETWPPERIYDLRWAATVVERALQRLGEECESRGRRRLFREVSEYLTADRTDISYETIAASLGIPVSSVKRLLHQLRRRYRALLREEVAHTVEKASDIDDEIRYLCAALAAAEG